MADIARLALSIDSSSVTAADRALLNFNRTAKETAAAAAQMKIAGAQWGLTASGLVAPTSAINAQLTGMSKGMKDAASATQTASQSAKTGQKDFTDLFRSLLNAREGVEGVIGGFLRLGTGAYLVTRAVQTTTALVSAAIKPFIDNAAAVQTLNASYGALLGSNYMGSSMVQYLQALGSDLPVAMKSMSDGTKTLLGFGFAASEVKTVLPKLAALAMGNSDAFAHLAVVYGQVRAQGKMYMNDIRQFTNAGVPMIEALSEVVKKPQSEIGYLIKAGKIGIEETKKAIELLTDEGGRFHSTLTAATDTLTGQLTIGANQTARIFALLGKDLVRDLTDAAKIANSMGKGIITRATINEALTASIAYATEGAMTKGQAPWLPYMNMLPATIRKTDAQNTPKLERYFSGIDFETVIQALREKQETAQRDLDAYVASTRGTLGGAPLTATKQRTVNDITAFIQFLMSAEEPLRKAFEVPPIAQPPEDLGGGAGRSHRWYQGGLPETLPYGGANDIRRTNAGYGYYGYVEPPLNPEMPAPYIDPNSRYRSTGPVGQDVYQGAYIHDTLGKKASFALGFEDATEDAEEFAKQIDNMVAALESAGKQSFVDSFKAMGKAWSEGGDGAAAFADTLAGIGEELLNMLPTMLLEAGLRAAIAGKWGLAAILIGASGLMAFTAGALDTEDTDDNGTATAAELADLYKYYIEAETFNQESRKRSALSGFANGTSFAPGGWSRVGERGPELMYVPRGASIIPHERTIGYADGVGSPPSSVSVIVNNTVTGTSARQETSEDGRTVTITVEKIVKSLAARGGLNTALATGANVKRKYTN